MERRPSNMLREVRSFLEKLNVARTEAKGNLKRSRDECALLEEQHQNTASELQHKTTQIEECERVLQLARKEKTELLERKDRITEHLEFCDEVLTVLCNGIKHLDDKYSAAAALVDKAGKRETPKTLQTSISFYHIRSRTSETEPPWKIILRSSLGHFVLAPQ
jgi:chromosome segregation ATPase